MPDLGLRINTESSLYGPTHNPWKRGRTAGGSSGGGVAAIASGMSPIGLGNDIGGSLRNPAYACGIASIKPSRGRVAQGNPSSMIDMPISSQIMLVNGVLARTVADVRLGAKHQIVVHTEAFGEGQEGDTLAPVMQGLKTNLKVAGLGPDVLEGAVITADSNFHSIENLKVLHNERADGYIPDNNFRKRDPRFSTAFRHKGNDIPRREVF